MNAISAGERMLELRLGAKPCDFPDITHGYGYCTDPTAHRLYHVIDKACPCRMDMSSVDCMDWLWSRREYKNKIAREKTK